MKGYLAAFYSVLMYRVFTELRYKVNQKIFYENSKLV